jgi:hypothetical protein
MLWHDGIRSKKMNQSEVIGEEHLSWSMWIRTSRGSETVVRCSTPQLRSDSCVQGPNESHARCCPTILSRDVDTKANPPTRLLSRWAIPTCACLFCRCGHACATPTVWWEHMKFNNTLSVQRSVHCKGLHGIKKKIPDMLCWDLVAEGTNPE